MMNDKKLKSTYFYFGLFDLINHVLVLCCHVSEYMTGYNCGTQYSTKQFW